MSKIKRSDIENMPAGRELDALIAITLMGGFTVHGDNPWSGPPPYSTDIASAWEVMEKMLEIKPILNYDPYSKKWYMRFNGGEFCSADTAELAICRAALLAVMEFED